MRINTSLEVSEKAGQDHSDIYTEKDCHRMFIGKIVRVLGRETTKSWPQACVVCGADHGLEMQQRILRQDVEAQVKVGLTFEKRP